MFVWLGFDGCLGLVADVPLWFAILCYLWVRFSGFGCWYCGLLVLGWVGGFVGGGLGLMAMRWVVVWCCLRFDLGCGATL